MQLTSSPRRALGLVAVGAIGMSTAVLGVAGVAQAAPLTPIPFTSSSSPLVISAGYCSVDWTLVGGSGGASQSGTPGANGGKLVVTTDVYADETFTFFPGTEGQPGAGGLGGAGGTNGDGQGNGGLAGADGVSGGGGGGGATTVQADGFPFLFAFGGNGGDADPDSSAGFGQGNGGNRVEGTEFDRVVAPGAGNGSVSGTVQPCEIGTPTVNWIEGGEKSATLQIWAGDLPDGASTPVYEYSLDEGPWQALVTGNDFQYEPTITGLVNGRTYSVRVRTTTTWGSSEPTVAQTVTPRHVLGAPTGVTATAGPGSITVTWAPPADPTGITGYEAWAMPAGAQSSAGLVKCPPLSAAARSCTIGVPVGQEYSVGVVALDAAGRGESAFVLTGKIQAAAAPATLPKSSGALSTTKGAVKTLAPGASVTLTGGGYLPGSTVTLLMYSTPTVLGTTVADASGNISATVTLPAGSGNHTLVAGGVDPSGAPHNLTMAVTLKAGAGLANTGADIALPLAGGAAALLLGGGLLVASRRRSAV
ncbi:fibronectin type III domain-containing protein [Blastococcus saxobsidens]|uniref:Fibronectin type III domain-containing protein n=1 Tax=Blastococcus saxobsidens TaxID=138336 RepID=A0A6L9VX37_9ACTN|nr:fibronectin type III domain-containing protein [Blastococcus saxobsidens]NEK84208.1 fibronectin type III domain-containing protein [Blastococcus saxobsidens]